MMKRKLLLLTVFICLIASFTGLPCAYAEEGEVLETVYVDSYLSLKELFEGEGNLYVAMKNNIFVSDFVGVAVINDRDQMRVVILDLCGHTLTFADRQSLSVGMDKYGTQLHFTITDSHKGGAVVFTHDQTNGVPGGIDNGGVLTLDGAIIMTQWETVPPHTGNASSDPHITADYSLIYNKNCFTMNSGSLIVENNRKQAIDNFLGTVVINDGTIDVYGDYSLGINNFGGTLTISDGMIHVPGKGSIGIMNQYGRELYTVTGSVPFTGTRWIEETCIISGGIITTSGEGSIGLCYENNLTVVNGNISSLGKNAVGIMASQNKYVKSEYDPPTIIGGKIIVGGCAISNYDGTPAFYLDHRGEKVSVSNVAKELKSGYIDVDPDTWYANDVYHLTYAGFFNGYQDNTFRPQGNITRSEFITLLARYSDEDLSQYENMTPSFSDIDPSVWYTLPIAWGADKGIIDGYSNGSFRPQNCVAREQLVTMLFRYAAYKETPVDTKEKISLHNFSDAESISDLAIPAMQWAVGTGLIQGRTGNRLAPQEHSTRAETAVILKRFRGIVDEGEQQ
jgi:hypothetical protein